MGHVSLRVEPRTIDAGSNASAAALLRDVGQIGCEFVRVEMECNHLIG
jgi:hypothetical protein